MPHSPKPKFSPREQQIMDVLYATKEASVSDVLGKIKDPPSYSAVRTIMGVLVEKGSLRRRKDGKRYLYAPAQPRSRAARSALRRVIHTFYGGSVEHAVIGMLRASDADLTQEQQAVLRDMIAEAKKEGR